MDKASAVGTMGQLTAYRQSSRGSPAPVPYAHQAGGHREQLSEEGGALVVPAPGLVAKPTGHGYWAGEDSFYEALAATDPELCRWCPAYHGTRTYAGRRHVILEDLAHQMRRPCVVDIKLGTCTVAPDASWPKRVSHLLKDRKTTTRSLGVRIIGTRTPPPAGGDGEAVVRNKDFGKRLRPSQMGCALRAAFSADGELCTSAVREFARCLEELLVVLTTAPHWRFVSSSLLFVFEPEGGMPPQLRLIDFAHAYPLRSASADHGVLYGLRNLLRLFCALLPTSPPPAAAAAADAVAVAAAAAGGGGGDGGGVDVLTARPTAACDKGRPGDDDAALVARGRVALHADELHEGLGHSELAPWLGGWLGFDGGWCSAAADAAGAAVGGAAGPSVERHDADDEALRKCVLMRPSAVAQAAHLRRAVLHLSGDGDVHVRAQAAAADDAAEAEAGAGAVSGAVRQLVRDAAAPRRAALLRSLDEQLVELRRVLGAGSVFQFDASSLQIECDVLAQTEEEEEEGAAAPQVRVLLTALEAPCMVRDPAFGAGYLAAVASVHAAVREVLGAEESVLGKRDRDGVQPSGRDEVQ